MQQDCCDSMGLTHTALDSSRHRHTFLLTSDLTTKPCKPQGFCLSRCRTFLCALLVGFLSLELQAWMGETTLISQPPIAHRKGDKKVDNGAQ